MKKKLEEPSLLNYSEFDQKQNNIKRKGLKWTISALPPNHKETFKFLEFRYKDQKKCIFFQKYRNLLFLDYIFTIPPE